MPPPLIQLKDIALTFGGTPLLDGAELSVSAGERVCLVGRNGSGKSTLLKIAAGVVEPDDGTRFVQPGATVRYLPQEADFGGAATTMRLCRHAGLGPTDDPYPRELSARATRPHRRRADRDALGRRGAPRRHRARARARSRHSAARRADQPSRPHHHRMAGSGTRRAAAPRSCSSATTAASSPRSRAPPSGSIAARRAGIDRGFGEFEAWRDEVLAEEERDQHKLDRKIVAEEHWLRYGVSGRRKRNVKRLAGLHAAAREPAHLSRQRRQRATRRRRGATRPASW